MVPTSQIYSLYINQLRVAGKNTIGFSLLFQCYQCFHSKKKHTHCCLPQRLCVHPNTSRYLGSKVVGRVAVTLSTQRKMVGSTVSFVWCFYSGVCFRLNKYMNSLLSTKMLFQISKEACWQQFTFRLIKPVSKNLASKVCFLACFLQDILRKP